LARKILLADDSVTAQNMGRKILADAGYEVITVNNGSAALKKIAEQKPDLIVLDVYMPGYSGLEVCQRLKEVKETARIPVLLTVGKLEPFKPEEARRVRAEGYIVKPFEASELLSALSKLEDRVVPRAESAKPGRFARAIAAVEEGRGDETVEANDSADDGWKSRIGFPSKKKKKQEDQEESEIYNPVNRDLRTVVERPAPREMAPREEGRVDVAALAAAAGLPKDVTPEELAALAAAAAQVQAAVDGREQGAAPPQGFEAAMGEQKPEASETKVEAKVETRIESKAESQPEAQPVPQTAPPEAGEIAGGATFAQQGADEAAAPAGAAVTAKESKPAASVRDFDVIAAPAVSNDDAASAQAAAEKKEIEEKRSDKTGAPVTMAVAAAAGAGYVAAGSTTHRWTAVPVAIAAEEAAVSLESEMQKAYAAFAAAEANQPGFISSPPAMPMENSVSAAMVEAPAGPAPDEEEIARTLRDVAHASAEAVDSTLAKLEAVAEANANSVPGVTQAEESSPKPGETHTEIVAAAIRDLEEKRELEAKEREARELEAREREAREREEAEAREREAREREAKEIEAREREAREREAQEAEAREQEAREREAKEIEAREREAREREAREAEARQQEAREREAREIEARERESREREAQEIEAREREAREREAKEIEAREREAREREAKEAEARDREAQERAAKEQAEAEAAAAASAAQAAAEPVAAVSEAAEPGKEKIAGGEMAENKESDLAATTAAAWASWRQIRETGDKSKPTGSAKAGQPDDDDEEYPELPPDRAAMAAAAGAEKSPSAEEAPEAAADDPEAIANIVDKVLADLRPKIAEEISKKLKKK
jgi:CheY-like chemotaxis protein